MSGIKNFLASWFFTVPGPRHYCDLAISTPQTVMPRRKRPSPPAPGSIPVRNIAPKPVPRSSSTDVSTDRDIQPASSSSRQSVAGSDIDASPCGVPQCTIPNCKLPTHLSYGRQRRRALLQKRRGSPALSDTVSEAKSTAPSKSMGESLRLPIDDNANGDFKSLFIQFFEHHFDRLAMIYRPQRRDPAFKEVVYRLALHNSMYCLTLVAQAHMGNIKDLPTNFDQGSARLTEKIYSQLLQMTREKVESFDLGDVDVLLLAIVALCEYDLKLDRHDALRSHHIGMTALVSRRGGVHNLGLSLPYVLRMDRFLALRANQLPQLASAELPTSNIVMRQSSDTDRGSYWQSNRLSLSDTVVSVCYDASALISLVEELDIDFDPSKQTNMLSPKLEYFHYLRENVDLRHVVLNHHKTTPVESLNKDLLALTAMKIIIYYVASANYLPIVTDILATRLWNLLTKAQSESSPSSEPKFERMGSDPSYMPTIDLADWADDMPMLLWLLFACAIPGSREASLSFTGHLASGIASESSGSRPSASRTSSNSRQGTTIVSPSSPRRHRYLPSFILHTAEHLVGERPISGVASWDAEIGNILESFVWAQGRLRPEFKRIMKRVDENVLARAEGEL